MEEVNERSLQKYERYYSEPKLRDKLKRLAKKAGAKVVYCVLLAYYGAQDASMSWKDKLALYGALGYFILPADFIPDWIPVVGFSDDLTALLAALKLVADHITPEVKQRAQARTNAWFGESAEAPLES